MPADTWYLMERGKVKGPYSLAELRSMRGKGQLNRFHQISSDRKEWVPVAALPELSPAHLAVSSSTRPSAGRAIGWCFIPLFTLYWLFMVYTRLCFRIKELRARLGMAGGVPPVLAFVMAFCHMPPVTLAVGGLLTYALGDNSERVFLVF